MKFKNGFKNATDDKIELRLKITDLMLNAGKQSKKPSFRLGYSVMDNAFGRAIAGSARSNPTFREIDDAFPKHAKQFSDDFSKSLIDFGEGLGLAL
jgi:hypothetical protein